MTIENFLTTAGKGFIEPLPYLVVLAALLLLYKVLHDWITPYDDRAFMAEGNKAVAITRAGAYLGVAIAAIGSLISGDEQPYWLNVGTFVIDGIIAIFVMTTAVFLFDRVIIRKVKNSERIVEGNVAVGLMEACAYISMGLITSASFSGGGLPFWQGILSAILFSFVGMATLAVIYLTYCLFWRQFKQCDVDSQIGRGNLAAAIDAGTLLIAMSITLWFSISGDFTGWGTDLGAYALAVLSSTLVVPVGRVVVGYYLTAGLQTTTCDSHHRSVARSLIVGFVSIAIGLMLGLIQFM